MLWIIILREIRHNVLSLRLHIALGLTFVIFGVGTVAYVMNYTAERQEYERYHREYIDILRDKAESNLSDLAVHWEDLVLAPRQDAFITDARESYFPNFFRFNGYAVRQFSVRPGSANPYLETFQELNWTFIVGIIISFMVLLLTFDSVSGEKEARTLAVSLANPVSRGTLLFGKYISVIISTVLTLLPGLALSLIILLASRVIPFKAAIFAEIIGFLAAVTLFIACIAAVGLLSSTIASRANVSLLAALAFWLLFVVVVPNTAVYWAQALFPIENIESMGQRISQARQDINNNAPQGSWSSSSNNPFLPQHELRAANQTKLLSAEMDIRNAHYAKMFHQFERARLITMISPVSTFEYLCESLTGGGYIRFREVWSELHSWQTQFLAWFKDKDAADKDSPHWYNPVEDYSTTRKGTSWEEVPWFYETPPSIRERIVSAADGVLVLSLMAGIAFALSFVLFVKYDVR